MNDFTPDQRSLIFDRDGDRCLSCGYWPVTMQHRRAKGMGGRGKKEPRLTCADGLPLCARCNTEVEGSKQSEGLRMGWKIPRSTPINSREIPYRDNMTKQWWLADDIGGRRWVDPGWAMERVQVVLAMEAVN